MGAAGVPPLGLLVSTAGDQQLLEVEVNTLLELDVRISPCRVGGGGLHASLETVKIGYSNGGALEVKVFTGIQTGFFLFRVSGR